MGFEIRTAAEVLGLALPGAWTRRRDARQNTVLHAVWQAFMDRGGPVALADVEGMVGRPPDDVRDSLKALDADDLIVVDGEAIRVAYPFTTGPNVFAVEVARGVERYACCAIDALGLAPMLGETIAIRSTCHHCGEPLVFDVTPDGPRALPDAMVWVAPRDACAERVASGL